MGVMAAEVGDTYSLSSILETPSHEPLLQRIKNSGYVLNAKGAEISKTLLKLSQDNDVARIEKLCNAYISHCEQRGNRNAKKLLHFYSRVADRFNEYMHHKRSQQLPKNEINITTDLVSHITGYENN